MKLGKNSNEIKAAEIEDSVKGRIKS